jgi:hypothetical protein
MSIFGESKGEGSGETTEEANKDDGLGFLFGAFL